MREGILLAVLVALGLGFSGDAEAVPVERDSFVIHEMGWAPVVVMDMTMPFPVIGQTGECRLVIRINEAVETIVDVVDCKEELKANTLRAANAWVLEVGRLEYYGQEAAFRARFVFNDREVYLQLNEAWLESAVEARPMGVRTSSLLLDRTAVPKYPKALRGSGEEGVCLLHIELTKSGKPELIEPLSCPEAFQAEAIKAAKRWRWHPPHSNGEKVRSEANIRMRFKAQ